MVENPWIGIARPVEKKALNMRRVDEAHERDFYWARDHDGACLLVMRAATASMPRVRLPQLRGVEVLWQPAESAERSLLTVRLLENNAVDIFRQLCLDIVSSARFAKTEADAAASAIGRTWRWHHLLRGGRGLLSEEEQCGLLNELRFLERHMLPALGGVDAVDAWKGPLGGAHDFAAHSAHVECKARGSSGDAGIHVSSEFQLDLLGAPVLYLQVATFHKVNDGELKGETVTEVARRVRGLLGASPPIAGQQFDGLLQAAGFSFDDDYSDCRLVPGPESFFEVGAGFPRLIPGSLPPGVRKVRYVLDLADCSGFASTAEKVCAMLGGKGEA